MIDKNSLLEILEKVSSRRKHPIEQDILMSLKMLLGLMGEEYDYQKFSLFLETFRPSYKEMYERNGDIKPRLINFIRSEIYTKKKCLRKNNQKDQN